MIKKAVRFLIAERLFLSTNFYNYSYIALHMFREIQELAC